MQNRKKIIIAGGGTAGWMTASLMNKQLAHLGWDICLIESPDIGIIGVGEGSTPQLKSFFDKLEISESEWMPACNATYKNGISFKGWSGREGYTDYFHPFGSMLDKHTQSAFIYNCYQKRLGYLLETKPDKFFISAYLANAQRAPLPIHQFPFDVLYGYHFDSHLLGQYLAEYAKCRGVEHISEKITDVILTTDGSIDSVCLEGGRIVSGDLFIDCTGFSGLLLQKKLSVPFISYASNLFNDAAVVVATEADNTLDSQTTSVAMPHGWRWKIPLTTRTGNGYVYSQKYCTKEQAEVEFIEALNLPSTHEHAIRHLKMKVGRVEQNWKKNCIAIGLSQGFIEPLEATALHVVQESIEGAIRVILAGMDELNIREFNNDIAQRFEGIRDYIVCHYRASARVDNEYWRDNTSNQHLSDSLQEMLTVWLQQGDIAQVLQKRNLNRYYNTLSWHSLLAGYGVFPTETQLIQDSTKDSFPMHQISDFLQRCMINFPNHNEVLS
ncbi:tryptophan halogenase family protein [Catenovulum sp. SX2]|uniref:tryptophan halogenase family protein n=1 Tax=Catenovulum sp. SX2 TaxID=3398614 RepID=UPI003F83526F